MSENKYLHVNIHCFVFKLWECDALFPLQVMSHSELKFECVGKKTTDLIEGMDKKNLLQKNLQRRHFRRQNLVYDLPTNQR